MRAALQNLPSWRTQAMVSGSQRERRSFPPTQSRLPYLQGRLHEARLAQLAPGILWPSVQPSSLVQIKQAKPQRPAASSETAAAPTESVGPWRAPLRVFFPSSSLTAFASCRRRFPDSRCPFVYFRRLLLATVFRFLLSECSSIVV